MIPLYLLALLLLALCGHCINASIAANSVNAVYDVTSFIHKLLHLVENGRLKLLTKKSKLLQEKKCLLGATHCRNSRSNTEQITVPTKETTTKSPPPPAARNREYQRLATTAEEAIPSAWFRDNYADPQLLLTRTANDYPTLLYSKVPPILPSLLTS